MFNMFGPKSNTISIPHSGNGKSGVVVNSRSFPEPTKIDKNLFKELKLICDNLEVDFEIIKEYDELFILGELEWGGEIFWDYGCDLDELLDVLIPLIREERLNKLLDGSSS